MVDFLDVYLGTVYSGDFEILTLSETGPDTGVFEGTIDVASGPAGSVDGVLELLDSGPPRYLPEKVWADCSNTSSMARADAVISRIAFVDALGEEIEHLHRYEDVRVRVVAPRLDDPQVQDSLSVTVRSPMQHDSELLVLTETGASTGVFEGSVPSYPASTYDNDGLLTAEDGDLITAEHVNVGGVRGPSTSARVRTSRLSFIDAQGEPVEEVVLGSRIYLRVATLDEYTRPWSIDYTYVAVYSELTGDEEQVVLTETGEATGVFEGWIDTTLGPPAYTDSGLVEAAENDVLKAEYWAAIPGKEIRAYAGVHTAPTVTITAAAAPRRCDRDEPLQHPRRVPGRRQDDYMGYYSADNGDADNHPQLVVTYLD